MSILTNLRNFLFRASPENPSTSLAKPATWLTQLFSPASKSGAAVTPQNVMSLTAVWRAFNLIAESLASMEWEVVRRKTDNSTRLDYTHSIYTLLNTEASAYLSSFDFWLALIMNTLIHGDGYALMDFNSFSAKVKSFSILDSTKIKVWKDSTGKIWYKNIDTNELHEYDRVIHLKWVTKDGLVGLSTLDTLRDAFGFALSSRDFGNTFYKNGAHLGGYVKHPAALSQDAYERLKKSWNISYGGIDKAGSTAILEEGAEYIPIGMKPSDAALLESQKFSIEDVSRITGVPPHLLAALDRATFNNIEHLSLEFAKYALRPWVIRIEKEFTRKAFTARERGKFFLRGDMTPFMVGDMDSQATMYSKMFASGALSINDVREKLGYNPIEGGDEHFVPLNMQPLKYALESPQNEPAGEQNSDSQQNLFSNETQAE